MADPIAAPVISWRTQANDADWPVGGKWDCGVVDAGFRLIEAKWGKVLIWNNRGNPDSSPNDLPNAPDVQDLYIMTTSNEQGQVGEFTGPVVQNRMIRVSNVSTGEYTSPTVGTFTALGGPDPLIKQGPDAFIKKHLYTPNITKYPNPPHSTNYINSGPPRQTVHPTSPDDPPVDPDYPEYVDGHYPLPGLNDVGVQRTVDILGVKNDGNKNNAKGNYVEIILDALPPATSPAGKFEFLIRLSYWYQPL